MTDTDDLVERIVERVRRSCSMPVDKYNLIVDALELVANSALVSHTPSADYVEVDDIRVWELVDPERCQWRVRPECRLLTRTVCELRGLGTYCETDLVNVAWECDGDPR